MQIILSEDEVKTIYAALVLQIPKVDTKNRTKTEALIIRFRPYIIK